MQPTTPTTTSGPADEVVIDLRDDPAAAPAASVTAPPAVDPADGEADGQAERTEVAAAASAAPAIESAEIRRAGLTAVLLLALLNVADVVLTELLLHRGAVELNPIAEPFLRSESMLWVKLAIVALLGLDFLFRRPRLTTFCLLWLVTGYYLCVVVLNGASLVAIS